MDISKRRLFDENYQQSLLKVTGNMPVVDIIEQMSHTQISYALVLQQKELVGIFTERDAVRAIANRTLFENITVAEAMTQPVITISKVDAEDIAIVLQKFHHHGIRHLPVMDNGELIGIVTQTSVLRVLESIRVNFAFETLQQTIDAKRAVSSLADITARKQTELEIIKSRDLLEVMYNEYIPDLVTHLFDSYNIRSSHIKLHFQVEDVGLDIESAIPCGLIVNELVSNALKYAFPNKKTGEILVKLDQHEHDLILIVQDNGVGLPVDFDQNKTKTLGLNLIQGLVKQLRGSIEINSQQGTEFKITFKKSRDMP